MSPGSPPRLSPESRLPEAEGLSRGGRRELSAQGCVAVPRRQILARREARLLSCQSGREAARGREPGGDEAAAGTARLGVAGF